MANDSPTTTPTPNHILSLGKERKREDKGKKEVRNRETNITRKKRGTEAGCRPEGGAAEPEFSKKTFRAAPL